MSAFDDAINGLETVLAANITGLHVYNHPPQAVNQFPAAIILVDPFDPRVAFGGHTLEVNLRVVMLFGKGDSEQAFQQMYHSLDPTETNRSIVKAVEADRTLNSTVDDAVVKSLENMGLRELSQGQFAGFDAVVGFLQTIA